MSCKKMAWRVSFTLICLFSLRAFAIAPAGGDAQLVVASQGGQDLTYGDIDEAMQRIPESDRAHFLDSPKRIEALINNLLLQKQLAAQGRTSGLDKDPEIAAATGMAQVQLLATAQMKKFVADLKAPDLSDLAKEEYVAHKERYGIPVVVDVKQILVSSITRSDEEAKALATQVHDKAVATPDQFDALIEQYSEDSEKSKNSGLIKDAGSAFHSADYAKAANALTNPGDFSAPVKTEQGYYILKLVARTPGQQKKYDEVREEIIARLASEFMRKNQADYIDGLRNNRIDANPERVAELRTRFAQTSAPAVPVAEVQPLANGKAPKKK